MVQQNPLYFIALVPPAPFRQEAYALKEHFRDQYGSKASLNSPPHITLYPPFNLQKSEEHFIAALQQKSRLFSPFEVRLNGFDAFPPRVIFINVEPSVHLRQLQQEINDLVPGFSEKEKKERVEERRFHPHMTVAFRDLSRSAFKEAWAKYKGEPLQYQWTAENLTLLRHNGRYWDELKQLAFGNQ